MKGLILSLLIGMNYTIYANENSSNNRLVVPNIMVISNTTNVSTGGYTNKSGKLINQGSPNRMFAGARLNKQIPSLDELKKLFNKNSLLSMGMYINKTREIDKDEYKKRQTSSGKDKTKIEYNNTFKLEEKGELVVLSAVDKSTGYPSIIFKNLDGKLEIVALKFQNGVVPAKLVNYSFSKRKKASSYLIELREKSREGFYEYLYRFDFLNTVNRKVDLANADKSYSYLYGNGVKVRWPNAKRINLNLCGSFTPKKKERYLSALTKAVKKWNTNTEITIKSRVLRTNYPPINDLDTQCVYVVRGFALNKSSTSPGTPAFVSPVGDLDSRKLIDADLVILDDVYDFYEDMFIKQAPSALAALLHLNKVLTGTMIHEIGHFLGLAHQFDGTLSIMSYDRDRSFSRYDAEAINALYSN